MTIDIEKLIEETDEDGSGEIDFDEFKALLKTDWIPKLNDICQLINSFSSICYSFQPIQMLSILTLPHPLFLNDIIKILEPQLIKWIVMQGLYKIDLNYNIQILDTKP